MSVVTLRIANGNWTQTRVFEHGFSSLFLPSFFHVSFIQNSLLFYSSLLFFLFFCHEIKDEDKILEERKSQKLFPPLFSASLFILDSQVENLNPHLCCGFTHASNHFLLISTSDSSTTIPNCFLQLLKPLKKVFTVRNLFHFHPRFSKSDQEMDLLFSERRCSCCRYQSSRDPIDSLVQCTLFNRREIKMIYRNYKQVCQ